MFRRPAIVVLIASASIFVSGIWILPLHEPDEGRYADIALSMQTDPVTPHLNGIRYFEKPPLYFWLSGASMKTFGRVEWAARLPSVVAMILTAAVTVSMASRAFGSRVAPIAGLIFATSPLIAFLAKAVLVDTVLLLFVTGTIAVLYLLLVEHSPEEPPARALALTFWALLALGTLTKGPIGVVVPVTIVACDAILSRQWRRPLSLIRVEGIALYLLIAAPWFVVMSLRNPGYATEFFISQNFGRFAGRVEFRNQPFWYYVPVLAVAFLPWSFWSWPTIRQTWRSVVQPMGREDRAVVFFSSAVIGPFVILSLAGSKLVYYLLPVFPPLSILVARDLAGSTVSEKDRRHRKNFIAFVAASFLLSAFLIGLSVMPRQRLFDLTHTQVSADDLEGELFLFQAISKILLPTGVLLSVVAVGSILAWLISRRAGPVRAAIVLAISVSIFEVAFPFLAADAAKAFSGSEMAKAVATAMRPGDDLIFYQEYVRTVPFYLGRPVKLWVSHWREFGRELSSDEVQKYSLEDDLTRFRNLLAGPRRVLIIADSSRRVRELQAISPVPLHEIARNGTRYLLTTRP